MDPPSLVEVNQANISLVVLDKFTCWCRILLLCSSCHVLCHKLNGWKYALKTQQLDWYISLKGKTFSESWTFHQVDRKKRFWTRALQVTVAPPVCAFLLKLYIICLVGKWADPGGTAMPGQLVTEPEQAPELYPLTKISLISKMAHGHRIRY